MSRDNVTAEDFWNEYMVGINGQIPIRELEMGGKQWRQDPKDHTSGKFPYSKFRVFWSNRQYIYKIIEHKIEVDGWNENDAVGFMQQMFDQNKSRTGRPRLSLLRPVMKKYYKSISGGEDDDNEGDE